MNTTTAQLKVYKSSAGSGKTTTLSLEYLKLTLGQRDAYRHILALTFTNKAAQEMKDRILEYLDQLILVDPSKKLPFFVEFIIKESPLYQNIQKAKGSSETLRVLINDARELKKNLLHNYSEYAVTTIDSFTNRLIRSFSHDLGLSFNYQVEMDADQMLKEAVEELVSRIDHKEELITKILTQYSRQKIDDEKSRNIVNDIKSRAKSLLNDVEEEFLRPLRKLELQEMSLLQKRFEKEVKAFEKELQSYGEAFIQICLNNNIAAFQLYYGEKGIYGYFNRFKNRDFKSIKPNNYAYASVEEGKWCSGKATPADKATIEAQSAAISNIFEQSQQLIAQGLSDYVIKSEINHGIYPFMVLMELEKILNQMKMDQQMIHISDFNKIISEKIADEPAPYIYERIGNKYQHYLLDEFQDTSVIQWHNLLPLVENSLSENHFNLIVGDAKQSIYRFRGSDVEQFAQFPKLISKEKDAFMLQREQLLSRSYQEEFLNANFRTGKNIVEFNNDLFQFIVDRHLPSSQKTVYDDLQQKVGDPKSLPSSVEIHQMDVKSLKKIDEKNQAYIERSFHIIKENIENGYEYKDIVVLARKNKHLIQLAHYLLSQGIPVISTESLHVSTSPLVQFLLSLINYLYEPKEKIYQTEIIHFLSSQKQRNRSDQLSHTLLNLKPENQLSELWKDLGIVWDQEEILKLEAYEALESLCRAFQLESTQPLLHFFLEAAFIFTQENHQSIGEFREWWAVNATDYKLDVPEDWNAVKLMSFHKSKGLEFPIVINHFSDAHMSSGGKPPEIWLNPMLKDYPQIESFPFKISKLEDTIFEEYKKRDDDLSQLDLINLFYVAMTRPQQKLYLLVDKYYKKSSKVINFQFDRLVEDYLSTTSLEEVAEGVFHQGDKNPQKYREVAKDAQISSLESIYILKNQNTPWRQFVRLALDTETNQAFIAAALWGQKVHAVLGELSYTWDLDFTLKKMKYQGIFEEEEQLKLKKIVQQVIEHPVLHSYFSPEVFCYSEREIFDLSADGKIKRPDYMVQTEDQIVIIDYKTGKAKIKDIDQVKEYISIIANHSKKDTKGFLVYISDTIIVKEV